MASKMAMISSPDLTITMCGSSGFGTMSVAQMLPSRLSSAKSVYRLTASRTLSRALTFWKHELFVAVFVEHTPPFKQRQNLTLTQNLISTSEISTQGDQSPWTPCGGFGRVGHRRVAQSHVSCAPSSNWTCGFPASSSPTIFFRRRAPQTGQVTHSPYHLVQPAAFIQELIVPALPSRPPTALMFASEP